MVNGTRSFLLAPVVVSLASLTGGGEAVPLVSQPGDDFIYAGLRTDHRSFLALPGAFVDVLDPIS